MNNTGEKQKANKHQLRSLDMNLPPGRCEERVYPLNNPDGQCGRVAVGRPDPGVSSWNSLRQHTQKKTYHLILFATGEKCFCLDDVVCVYVCCVHSWGFGVGVVDGWRLTHIHHKTGQHTHTHTNTNNPKKTASSQIKANCAPKPCGQH